MWEGSGEGVTNGGGEGGGGNERKSERGQKSEGRQRRAGSPAALTCGVNRSLRTTILY